MNIAVVGATGHAGSSITAEALRRGHTVTAIARQPEKLPATSGLTLVTGDARDPAQLAPLLAGHDAVVSAVRFVESEPAALIEAVRSSGVKRYLVVGGAASLEVAPGQLLLDSPQFPAAYRPEATGGKAFLDLLRTVDDLDWTFVSPSMLFIEGPRTGVFRLGDDALLTAADGRSWISFDDFAIALLDELEHPAHIRRRFTVGY